MKLTKFYWALLLFPCLTFSGCKNKKGDDIIIPALDLYKQGLTFLDRGKPTEAAAEFDKIFFQHPGDDIAPQAELMNAYSLFLATQYDEAVDVLDTFIKLHPMNVDIAYAHYLKALSYYMQISNIYLDQSRTALAKSSFEEVIKRFPNTRYAVDSALKIDLVNDHLAGKEMEIGRGYLRQNNPSAAINRFQNVIEDYQTTSHTAEALYRLVVSYTALGLPEEAKKYAAVLGANYRDSHWYKYSYSLINKGT